MDPTLLVTIFNLVAPHVFRIIDSQMNANPSQTYQESLEQVGVRLDAEYAQLLADMAKAVAEGAVPRTPSQS